MGALTQPSITTRSAPCSGSCSIARFHRHPARQALRRADLPARRDGQQHQEIGNHAIDSRPRRLDRHAAWTGSTATWTFAFGERRGNRFFTDQTGAFVQDVGYQPYGEVASASGAQPGSQKYTNAQWNGGDALAALGLSQLGARIYDPVIGRFLSRDPLLIPRTAATTNPYAFASNDPVNSSDPTGLCPECEELPPIDWFPSGGGGPSHPNPKPQGPYTSTTGGTVGVEVVPNTREPDPKSLYLGLKVAEVSLDVAGASLEIGAELARRDLRRTMAPGAQRGQQLRLFGKYGNYGRLWGYYGDALGVYAAGHKFMQNPSIGTGAGVAKEVLTAALNRTIVGHLVTKPIFLLEQVGWIGPGVWNPTDRANKRAIERLEAFGAEQAVLAADKQSEARLREFRYNLYKDDVSYPEDDYLTGRRARQRAVITDLGNSSSVTCARRRRAHD